MGSWRARDRLRKRRTEGETLGTAAQGQAAVRPSRADHEGAKLSEVPRGAVPVDEREHEPEGAVVVPCADLHPRRDGRVADATPQELLRGQEARLIHSYRCDQAVHSVRDMWGKARKFSFLDKLGLNYSRSL